MRSLRSVKRAWAYAETDIDSTHVCNTQPAWDDYRAFLAVARELSVTKGASVLGIGQPAVSRRIESLEGSLGVKLFQRTHRGIVLTQIGERVARQVEEAALLLGRTTCEARALSELEGECRIAMSEGLANAWFVRHFLPIFQRRHPRLSVRLGTSADYGGVSIPPYDIEIRYGSVPDADHLMTVKLGTFHFRHFASRAYAARFGLPQTMAEMQSHHIVDVTNPAVTSGPGITSAYSSTSFGGGIPLSTNSGQIAATAVAAGIAIGFLPSYAYVSMPELVLVPAHRTHDTAIQLIFARDADERPAVRAMIDFLRYVAFDRRRMPWFSDDYVEPTDAWRSDFEDLLADEITVAA